MQVSQYVCSTCGTVLKETAQYVPVHSLREECPGCGSMLAETLTRRTIRPAMEPLPKFQTADTLRKLKFDIPKIDSFLTLTAADLCCISGPGAYLLMTRLCVRSLLPRKYGGLGSPYVMVADCGNRTDVYRTISFARQYGMNKENVADRILVIRAFTVPQVNRLLSVELPRVVAQYQAKCVVIPGLLNAFDEDPHMRTKEVKREIGRIVRTIKRLSEKMLVLTSLQDGGNAGLVLPVFSKRISLRQDRHSRLTGELYDQGQKSTIILTEREIKFVSKK